MPQTDVVVVATFIPKPGRAEDLERVLRDAVREVHREPGCLLYALHRIIRGAEGFTIIERWESPEALAIHGRAEAFAALATHFDDLLAKPLEVAVLQPLADGVESLGRL